MACHPVDRAFSYVHPHHQRLGGAPDKCGLRVFVLPDLPACAWAGRAYVGGPAVWLTAGAASAGSDRTAIKVDAQGNWIPSAPQRMALSCTHSAELTASLLPFAEHVPKTAGMPCFARFRALLCCPSQSLMLAWGMYPSLRAVPPGNDPTTPLGSAESRLTWCVPLGQGPQARYNRDVVVPGSVAQWNLANGVCSRLSTTRYYKEGWACP